MIEFENLRFKEMLKDEIITLGPNMVKIITPFLPVAAGITATLNRFKDQWKKLDPFMQSTAGSVLTDEIILLDGRRDKDLVGIKTLAKAMLNHRNPAKVAAAELVIKTMNSFDKNIPKLALAVQTETVVKLVNVFETDVKVKEAITLLGLTEWLPPMTSTNLEVGNKFIGRTQEAGEKPDTNFLEQRPAAETSYLFLIKMIDSFNTVDESNPLDVLIAQLNELIAKANLAVAQRKAKGGKGGTDNSDGPTPPTP